MRRLTLLLLFLWVSAASAAEGLVLDAVKVDCPKSTVCQQRTLRFEGLKGQYRSRVHLKVTLRIMASDGGYQTFAYELFEEEGKHTLSVRFRLKPTIAEINIGFLDRTIDTDPYQLITLKEGEYFESQRLKENMEGLQKRLEGLGFPHNTHQLEVIEKERDVTVNIAITLGPPRIFKSI